MRHTANVTVLGQPADFAEDEESNRPISSSQSASFSSYPGFLYSSDDFLLLSSNLLITETTISLVDSNELKDISRPEDDDFLLGWMRLQIANRLARSVSEWVDWMSTLSSGTMNSQWVVVDFNRVQQAQRILAERQAAADDERNGDDEAGDAELRLQLLPGTVSVMEQLPHSFQVEDVSAEINSESYFAGYNRPRSPEARRVYLGRFADKLDDNDEAHYESAARGRIIRRDHHLIKDLRTLGDVIRLNDYRHDELSRGCPCLAPAARCDLTPLEGSRCRMKQPEASGATDAKMTNAELALRQTARVIAGPPSDEENGILPFSWSEFEEAQRERLARLKRMRAEREDEDGDDDDDDDHDDDDDRDDDRDGNDENADDDDDDISLRTADSLLMEMNSTQHNHKQKPVQKSFLGVPRRPLPHYGQPDTFDFDWIDMQP
jgi:hypothetical protein